ncbi:acetyl-CoA C-acetyltransferase [Chitinimonas viridis]|uniref:Acetyl-CoA C-acetyltransferase n=1 Tax=Chitinimonas viridis TaxID=664880 RepID=A0ABT8B9S1_9NEIS|nr:acetyl-CoA C-acetyltransferase [Chitinimonas viridis]MDN3578510.1 acetyl-CoA C-acetyltransferase [Chitinimonas viridis]
MTERTLRRVAILGGSRIPFCRSNTQYQDLSNLDMLTAALNGLADRYQLAGVEIDEVGAGAVISHSKDWNLAREAVLSSKLSPLTTAYTVQMACGTSLQAAVQLGAKIAIGQIDSAIAAGTDTTSDAPIVFGARFAKRLIKLANAKSLGERFAAFKGFRPGELKPASPNAGEPRTRMSMGQHCEIMAKQWGISREEQDKLAWESHQKGARALAEGFFDDLIVPCAGVSRDNHLRPDSTLEKLATLKPAFDKESGKGTLTAGNSTPLTDGASSVLLASEDWAAKRGLPVQAYLTFAKTASVDFVAGEGLLMAPTIAVARLLQDAGLTLQDFDFYEIHEAFAAQVLCTLRAWESDQYCRERLGLQGALGAIDPAKLNVNGSSLAFGHPFAATGGRVLATLAKLLNQRGSGRGLISICTAGGMGIAAILEKP